MILLEIDLINFLPNKVNNAKNILHHFKEQQNPTKKLVSKATVESAQH